MENQQPELSLSDKKDIYINYVNDALAVTSKRINYNAFYTAFNTGVYTVLATDNFRNHAITIALLITLIAINVQWLLSIRSFRLLNSAKFELIHKMEQELGLSIKVYADEWKILQKNKYHRLTVIDKFLPLFYIIVALCTILLCYTKAN